MGRKKNRQFVIDDDGFINVFVDGCCLNPDKPVSASGYGIYFGPKNRCKVYGPCKKKATNTIAEIQSAYLAIDLARQLGVTKLRINTDSQVVFDAGTKLISIWKANNWESIYDGKPIKDRRYFEKFDAVLRRNPKITIDFRHVDGHSGNENHNEADHLAKRGAELHCNFYKLQI